MAKKSSEITKKKRGQPTDLTDAAFEKALKLARDGKTQAQIAQILNVHVNTVTNWKKQNQDFLWALNEARLEADEKVKASLYARATGYTAPETKVFCVEGEIVTHEVEKHYPPDVTAQIFWLKNRQPDEWRDKTHLEHSVTDNLAERLAKAKGRKSE